MKEDTKVAVTARHRHALLSYRGKLVVKVSLKSISLYNILTSIEAELKGVDFWIY